jgi:hypothetical protein
VNDKSINHLFLDCDFFGHIWFHVLRWLGISGGHQSNICMHVLQFDVLIYLRKTFHIVPRRTSWHSTLYLGRVEGT